MFPFALLLLLLPVKLPSSKLRGTARPAALQYI
jgi:hypothetical protein